MSSVNVLTVGSHSYRYALLEATFLALVSGHLVDDTLPLVLAGVGWVEVFLNRPPEEPLQRNRLRDQCWNSGTSRCVTKAQDTLNTLPCNLRMWCSDSGSPWLCPRTLRTTHPCPGNSVCNLQRETKNRNIPFYTIMIRFETENIQQWLTQQLFFRFSIAAEHKNNWC